MYPARTIPVVFTFSEMPQLHSMSPIFGPISGGIVLDITVQGFEFGTVCRFGLENGTVLVKARVLF